MEEGLRPKMTALDTFLGHCHGEMMRTAKALMVDLKCPAILAVVKPAPPTLLGTKRKCPVMFAALSATDAPILLDVLFSFPPGTGMGVFR